MCNLVIVRDAFIDHQPLYRYCNINWLFLNVISHLHNTSMSYDPFFCSVDVRAEVCTKMLVLTCFLEIQAAGQHRPLQVNYVFSTKTDIGPVQW